MRVINGAKGGSGPVLAQMCLESMLGGASVGVEVDLIIVEFAINEVADCGTAGPRMERLLEQLRKWAPAAFGIFLNTFSPQRLRDASICFVPLARQYGFASLSLQDALLPLLRNGTLSAADLFQPPMWTHVNVEGHRFLAAIVARYLNDSLARAHALPPPDAARMALGTPELRLLGRSSGIAHVSSNRSTTTCKQDTDIDEMLASGRGRSRGWRKTPRKGYMASMANATLELPFACEREGCGLQLSVTKSYQPLGLLDAYVDGVLVASQVSATDLTWAKARNPMWTVQHYVPTIRPRAAQARQGGLARGEHRLTVVARGETDPAVEALHLPSSYTHHEVHFRGFAIQEAS